MAQMQDKFTCASRKIAFVVLLGLSTLINDSRILMAFLQSPVCLFFVVRFGRWGMRRHQLTLQGGTKWIVNSLRHVDGESWLVSASWTLLDFFSVGDDTL
jgi:hypothetical protein